jgi:hypothetical protein
MSRRPIMVGILFMALAISLLFTISALSSSNFSLKLRASEATPNQEQANRLEAELLVLRAEGFHPKEITRPPGPFLLVVQNHSSAEEISLVLRQERGVAIREARTSRGLSKSRELVNLPPGRYVLTEANHPEWNCTIVITSN